MNNARFLTSSALKLAAFAYITIFRRSLITLKVTRTNTSYLNNKLVLADEARISSIKGFVSIKRWCIGKLWHIVELNEYLRIVTRISVQLISNKIVTSSSVITIECRQKYIMQQRYKCKHFGSVGDTLYTKTTIHSIHQEVKFVYNISRSVVLNRDSYGPWGSYTIFGVSHNRIVYWGFTIVV